jgi:hypothetical protein
MPITYSRISNGDAFDASSLNTGFSSVESSLNALTKADVAPETFGRDHLPSLVVAAPTPISQAAVVEYTRANAAYVGWGHTPVTDWDTINTNGGAGGGTDLELTISAVDPTDSKYGGILVLLNVQVQALRDFPSAGSGSTQSDFFGIFAIQVYAGSSWFHLARTERYVRGDQLTGATTATRNLQSLFFDIPIRTLVKASDVSNNSITKIRAVCAIADNFGGTAANNKMQLKRCTLSAIALQGSLS